MSAQFLLRQFCDQYELDYSKEESGSVNLAFESGVVVSATPSLDDSFVNITCLIETDHLSNDSPEVGSPEISRRLLEMQAALWRTYGAIICAVPSSGPIFLVCDVEGSADWEALSRAIDSILKAAQEVGSELIRPPMMHSGEAPVGDETRETDGVVTELLRA